jgi:FixJ family two-component response regulator
MAANGTPRAIYLAMETAMHLLADEMRGLWMHPGATPDSDSHPEQSFASCPPRVLIADDQATVCEALRLLLKSDGYETELVSGPASLLESLERRDFDLVLLDLNYTRDTTSGREGLDLLTRIRAMDQTLPVVVMTAWSNVDLAVEAMRRGACDFVQKPWDNKQVLASVRHHVERHRAQRRERSYLSAEPSGASCRSNSRNRPDVTSLSPTSRRASSGETISMWSKGTHSQPSASPMLQARDCRRHC